MANDLVVEAQLMPICVIGCGHLGLVTSACLSAIDHQVVGVDRNAKRIGDLEQGCLPVYEPYLNDLISRSRSAGTLHFTTQLANAVQAAVAVFLCVDVPQMDNGESDFFALDSAARELGRAVNSSKLIVERSTVPVKTGAQLKHVLRVSTLHSSAQFAVAAHPQLLRSGVAVDGFFHPARLLFGADDAESESLLREIYAPILRQDFECPLHPHGCPSRNPPELLLTSVQSAELIKLLSNSYLAIKISYANVLAELCESLGGNVQE